MNFKTTLVLLVVVLLVAVYLLWDTGRPASNTPGAGTGAGPTAEALFPDAVISPDKVARLELTFADGSGAVIEKQRTDWVQTAPARFALNAWSIESLVRAVGEARVGETFTPGQSGKPTLAEVGLEKPSAVVTLTMTGEPAASYTVKIGRRSVAGGRAYVMVQGDPRVRTVDDPIARSLEGGIHEWRRRSLSVPGEREARRVILTREGGTIDLVKSDGDWTFTGPHSGRGSADAVRDLLSAAVGISIQQFISDAPGDPSAYGLDRPTMTLAVDLASTDDEAAKTEDRSARPEADAPPPTPRTERRVLTIGGPATLTKDRYFATWSDRLDPDRDQAPAAAHGVVFTISNFDPSKFPTDPDRLRDKRITLIKPDRAREVGVERAGGAQSAVTLSWSSEGWKFKEPGPGYAADREEARKLVEEITSATAESFTRQVPGGEPEARIRITAIGRSEPDVLRVHRIPATGSSDKDAAAPAMLAVFRNQEAVGSVLPEDKLARAFAPALSLRDRTVARIESGKIAAMTLEQSDGLRLRFVRGEKQWALEGQDRFEDDTLRRLTAALDPLRAESWGAPETTDTPPAAPAPERRVTLSIEPGDGAPIKLSVTLPARLATAEGIAGVEVPFVIGPELGDLLEQEYRDRTLLTAASSDIESVGITLGGQTLTVRRIATGEYQSDEGSEVDGGKAAAIFDALAGLRVERYLPERPADLEGDAKVKLVVQARGKPAVTFLLWPSKENGSAVGSLAERWFRLSPSTVAKLTESPVKKDATPDTEATD